MGPCIWDLSSPRPHNPFPNLTMWKGWWRQCAQPLLGVCVWSGRRGVTLAEERDSPVHVLQWQLCHNTLRFSCSVSFLNSEILLPYCAECFHPHPAEKFHFIGLIIFWPSVVLMTSHLSHGALLCKSHYCSLHRLPCTLYSGALSLGSYRLVIPWLGPGLVPPSPSFLQHP